MLARPPRKRPFLEISEDSAARLIQAAQDSNPVAGLTHNFYRYPARFSPTLVREVICAFTDPGDLVFDPFVGGGTTLVEALATGRHGIGTDISALAAFVSEVKTTLYTETELKALSRWANRVAQYIGARAHSKAHRTYEEAGYLRHLGGAKTWRLRKAIAQALTSAEKLKTVRLEKFGRCVVLRTAQWALDGRKVLPRLSQFREKLPEFAHEMIGCSSDLARVATSHATASAQCLHRSTAGLEQEEVFMGGRRPRLVVTSPPYPGVHVLYHRWQIHGGKETPAPFWIADRRDGDGSAYYTMGARNSIALRTYFEQLRATLNSVAAVCDQSTTVVQIVAFSEPEWQLPRYLSVADDAGFEEHLLPSGSGRLWRSVPNRKWYASQKGHTSGSHEVVLFHRLRRKAI